MGHVGEIFHSPAVCWCKNYHLTFLHSPQQVSITPLPSLSRHFLVPAHCSLVMPKAQPQCILVTTIHLVHVGGGTLKKLSVPNLPLPVVVLGLWWVFGPCWIPVTQDKRQDLSQRWIMWPGHMDGLPICAGMCTRDGSRIPSEHIKDWVVTAGQLGGDGYLLLLLSVDLSCWTRKALSVDNQCPAVDGRVCCGSSLSEQALFPATNPWLSFCLDNGNGKCDHFCAEWVMGRSSACLAEGRWAGSTKIQEFHPLPGQRRGCGVGKTGRARPEWGWLLHWTLKAWSCMALHYSSLFTFFMWGHDNLLL